MSFVWRFSSFGVSFTRGFTGSLDVHCATWLYLVKPHSRMCGCGLSHMVAHVDVV